jgi:hypothetical protein
MIPRKSALSWVTRSIVVAGLLCAAVISTRCVVTPYEGIGEPPRAAPTPPPPDDEPGEKTAARTAQESKMKAVAQDAGLDSAETQPAAGQNEIDQAPNEASP